LEFAAGGCLCSAGGPGHFSRFVVSLWSSVSEFPCNHFGKLVASACFSQAGCQEEVLFPSFVIVHYLFRIMFRTIVALGLLVMSCHPTLYTKLMMVMHDELEKNTAVSTTRTYIQCVAAIW
jgi:hypothetical protein